MIRKVGEVCVRGLGRRHHYFLCLSSKVRVRYRVFEAPPAPGVAPPETYLDPSSSGPNIAGVERPGCGHIGGALNDGPPVRENRERMLSALETQQHAVGPDGAVRPEPRGQLFEIHRPPVLVNLHRVPPAQCDMRLALPAQMAEVPAVADLASCPGFCR